MKNNNLNSFLIDDKSQYIKAVILLFALIVLYFSNFTRLIQMWNYKPQSSHGYFVLPISIWFCWRNRSKLTKLSINGSYSGLFLIFLGMVLFSISEIACIDIVANLSFMISLAGIICATLGINIFRAFLFPYLFLLFMFPIPDFVYVGMTSPMKIFASDVSTSLIQAFGIPTFQDGNILQLANFKMEVVEACSGMRSLITYLMLGTILSVFLEGGPWRKYILVISTIPIALVNNIIRITGTAILAQSFGQEVAHGFYHEFTGLITFTFGLILMICVYSFLKCTNAIKGA